MRRLLLLAAITGFVVWRARTLDRYDRAHGFGPYADLLPADRSGNSPDR